MKRKTKTAITSSAEVVDSHLILALPNAVDPVVWRMALDKIGTASFEIKEIKTSGHFKLVLKPKKGTAELIATFETKDEALAAMMQASDAMQNPSSEQAKKSDSKEPKINIVTPQTAIDNSSAKKGGQKWLWLFLGLILVIGLYAVLSNMMPNRIENFGSEQQAAGAQLSSQGSSARPQTGVPLSADDFLNGL